MERPISEIVQDFNQFQIVGDYLLPLSKLTDELLATGKPEEGLDAMFALLERYPDEEIGSPGPLIHAIQKCQGYEEKLIESIKRRPSTLAIWTLFKLIERNRKEEYLEALKEVLHNENASMQIREDAALLLSWLGKG